MAMMAGDVTRRGVIEDALEEIDEALRSGPPGPAIRELRVRQGALFRVVRGWIHLPPHDAQIAAMLECVLELRAQVLRVSVPSRDPPVIVRRGSRPPPRSAAARASASQARTTKPPPRRDASMRTTRPPPAPPSSRRG
jgi:hypothetical protein